MKEKNKLIKLLNEIFDEKFSKEEIVIETPKDRTMGDLAIPCFNFAKKLKKSPNEIAQDLAPKIKDDDYEKIEAVGGYVNIFLNRFKILNETIKKIAQEKELYGALTIGKNQVIVIDYSAPNIAKPFGVGHLRSTVIGNALRRICLKLGYEVVGVNHLGDWGTQFGKLIVAYNLWGDSKKIAKSPIGELEKLYVKFHEEALKDEELNEEARKAFKKLEEGDANSHQLWQSFRRESLKEFQKTYDLLGINDFESYDGESFYNDKMMDIIKELKDKQLLKDSQGAKIVEIGDLTPALIQKKDGATLYITRDLATAFYRKKTYNFSEALYVVGNEQQLHFKQLKAVIKQMGYQFEQNMHHVNFGLILQDGKKMSTRKGKTIKLYDVLCEAIERVKKYNDDEIISKQIGIGAVIFNDLKQHRTNDVEFNLDDILRFEGETGPYVQYTYARIQSLLEHSGSIELDYEKMEISELIWYLVFKMYNFSNIIEKAKDDYDPSIIAKYALSLAQDFNKFYAEERILDEDEEKKQFKLDICNCVGIVLKESLQLLGIESPSKM